MARKFLKNHYSRRATVLTSEQIEEIRCLEDKVPMYKIMRKYHISEDRINDIWNNREHLQQDENVTLEDILNKVLFRFFNSFFRERFSERRK
jgi:hypothetical protein